MRLFFLLLFLPISVFAQDIQLQCQPVANHNLATVDGKLNFIDNTDGTTKVNGFINLKLQRYSSDGHFPVLGFTNLKIDGNLETNTNSDGTFRTIKAASIDPQVQYILLSLDLKTSNANSWVRLADGTMFFANCSAGQ